MTILCQCNNCDPSGDNENGTCVLQPGGQCFSAIEEHYFAEENVYDALRTFGCFSAEDRATLQCQGNLVSSYNRRTIQCCNFTDLCNRNLLPEYKPRNIPPTNYFFNDHANILAFVLFSIIGACLAICFYLFYLWFRRPNTFVNDLISSTGSGAGKPLLIQQTIGRKIDRLECLGEGRFTITYKCVWDTRKIVEKLFYSGEEERWAHETEFYQNAKLRHENILGYIWSDILPNGQRAIYLEYMPHGSLFDYLETNSLNETDFWTLIKSAVAGVTFLHTHIVASFKRPAVAHRDLQSKNILINNQKQCVISNFEIAIMHTSAEELLERVPDIAQGSPRYMAPEVALGIIKADSFEAYKKADMYSLGLVFFEIAQRLSTKDESGYIVDEHLVPYFDVLPKIPTIEDMKTLFCKYEPLNLITVPPRLEKKVSAILWECLNFDPEARPNALRIKKTLKEMKEI